MGLFLHRLFGKFREDYWVKLAMLVFRIVV